MLIVIKTKQIAKVRAGENEVPLNITDAIPTFFLVPLQFAGMIKRFCI